MPTYDYKCLECNQAKEVLHSINILPYVECQNCEEKMVKVFSAGIAVHFKGSGFYETDYKGK
jgi:putative FmdB family regulatory protein